MEYKIIKKTIGHGIRGYHIVRDNGIGVQKQTISFHRGFILTYGSKRYVEFAENEYDCLCFRMTDKQNTNSYRVTTTKNGAYIIHNPLSLQKRILEFGKYDVTQDGEWFVTECKLKKL
jgi:hypothetical protein